MITAHIRQNNTLFARQLGAGEPLPSETVWIDLLSPDSHEEKKVETFLSVDIPTREEMEEIEASSRIYQEGHALYMTATMLLHSGSEKPESVPVTFILAEGRLVTLRYADPLPFRLVAAQVQKEESGRISAEEVLANLLDVIIDRLADILEAVQKRVDNLSEKIFVKRSAHGEEDYSDILRDIGLAQSLAARSRESLVSFGRLLSFLNQSGHACQDKITNYSLDAMSRDIASLSDYASFISNNINFLLNATLGMINSQQTGIIKIFSVAAVVFLPPTLIASIYGMNFRFMPELSSPWGYPLSLALMILSAFLPYWYFKRRGWL